jgi:hypothetical protein
MMLLTTSDPPTDLRPLIKLDGSIRHASFIKLLPFGFTGAGSKFDMSIEVMLKNMSNEHAAELHLTNRTIFWLHLCNEDEWKTIKSVTPSYCNTESYQQGKLCHSFPLNTTKKTSDTETYLSKSRVQHEVKETFFGRLVVSSCELKVKTLKRSADQTFPDLEEEVEMTLSSGLTMSNGGQAGEKTQYIGFENNGQQMLVMAMLFVYILLGVAWSLMLIFQGSAVIKLQARFLNIFLSKIILFVFKYAYWIKRERGDVWSTYKGEMLELHSAMQMLALAVMLECVLLVSVGWSITQKKLSGKSHQLVYCTLGGYFLSIFIHIISSRLTSVLPLLEVMAFLLYLVATFSTYYVIGFSTSVNIEALETQLNLIERYMGVDPTTTPSWTKLSMFTKFRTWVVVYVTATTVTEVASVIVRGNDDHEKYDLWVDAAGYSIELIAVCALCIVFRPRKRSSYFRQIPVLEIDGTDARNVPTVDDEDSNSSTASGVTLSARLHRLPTVMGAVILAPYQDQQALPPVVVGRLLDARRSGGGLGRTLTGRVMVHPAGDERNNVEMVEVDGGGTAEAEVEVIRGVPIHVVPVVEDEEFRNDTF